MPSAFENQSQDSKYHEVCTSWPSFFLSQNHVLTKVNEMKTLHIRYHNRKFQNWEDEEGTGKVGNLIEFEKSCDHEEY